MLYRMWRSASILRGDDNPAMRQPDYNVLCLGTPNENPDRTVRYMNPAALAIASSVGVFLGVVVCLEIGYRLGRRSAGALAQVAFEGIGAMEAAVFALLGLLLAFSFAGSTDGSTRVAS